MVHLRTFAAKKLRDHQLVSEILFYHQDQNRRLILAEPSIKNRDEMSRQILILLYLYCS